MTDRVSRSLPTRCRALLAALPMAGAGLAAADTLPYWLFGDEQCSATLITPRVAVTSDYCPGDVRRQRSAMRQRSTGQSFPGRLLVHRSPPAGPGTGDPPQGVSRSLALFVFDQPGPDTYGVVPEPVLSYHDESRLLRNPRADRFTELGGYVQPRSPSTSVVPPREVEWITDYLALSPTGSASERGDKPMVHRTVSAMRAAAPSRFELDGQALPPDDGPGPDVLGRVLRSRLNGHVVPDAVAEDMLLATVGDADDGVTRLWSETARRQRPDAPRLIQPFGGSARGVGLLASASAGPGWGLVGVVTDSSGIHVRLSAFLPAIYRVLLEQGLRDDAKRLARRLLVQGATAVIGNVRYYDNPHSGHIEFFRLAALPADGLSAPFPTDGRDDEHWEYLGTALPSSREVLAPLRVWQAQEMHPPIGKRYVRFNGITRQVEYFRLKAHDGDGRAPVLPSLGASDAHWTYEGTDLQVRGYPFAVWTPPTPTTPTTPTTPVIPLPGTGPALPGLSAARQ